MSEVEIQHVLNGDDFVVESASPQAASLFMRPWRKTM